MNFLVVGAGATGCAIGAYLKRAGKTVTLIGRGKRLEAINRDSLRVNKKEGSFNVNITVEESTFQKYDVIFVCVKDYSLGEVLPVIKKASHEKTVVIPILNVYATGDQLREMLFMGDVLWGCIYITAEKETDNSIYLSSDIFRIVFGSPTGEIKELYREIEKELLQSGIKAKVSDNIKRDSFKKFSFISPMAAACTYTDKPTAGLKEVGLGQTLFINCTRELMELALKMGIDGLEGTVEKNLQLISAMEDSYLCSMHKDLRSGAKTEMEGLIFYVVKKAKEYKVKVPTYEKIAEHFGFRIGCDCENRVAIDGEIC